MEPLKERWYWPAERSETGKYQRLFFPGKARHLG
jgi:hypothetical protein